MHVGIDFQKKAGKIMVCSGIVKLAQVSFQSGGKALVEGKPFTGVVRDILKSGDHFEMNYLNGVLQDAKRAGLKSYVKQYTDNGVFEYTGDKLTVGAKKLDIRGKVGKLLSILEKKNCDECKYHSLNIHSRVIRKDCDGNIIGGYRRTLSNNNTSDRLDVVSGKPNQQVVKSYLNGKKLKSLIEDKSPTPNYCNAERLNNIFRTDLF